MADKVPSLDDLLKSIQEEDDNIPGLDDLLNDIRNEDAPKSSSAIAVVPKKPDDLVEEDIDSQILSILGLEDVFDLTYEEYYRELRTAAAAGRMPGSRISTESIELITEELKRVKGKTGRFKVKPKKVDINKVLDRKQPAPPGAIVKAQKLIPSVAESAPEVQPREQKSAVDVENLQDDLMNGIGNILESLITVRTVLQSQSKTDQQAAKEDRKETEKKKKKEREAALEKKKPKSPILKAITKPVDDFFDVIKRFFVNVLLGSVVLGMFRWLKDPSNKNAVDGFGNFLQNNAGLILGGLLALAALPLAPTLLSLTKALLSGTALLGGALGKLGSTLLKIPGVAPFLGMTVLAPAAGMLATKAFETFVAPQITTAAAKLDLGAAAGDDPLVRQSYSQLKEEGKAYTETIGRGGKKVRVEKTTTQMTDEEKKKWDTARAKEAKARELAVDFSRSNQDLYNLNEKLKNLQKEKPRNLRGGGKRSQSDIDAEIQNVKEEIKVKEKEKAAKKKTLYNYLKIDPSKPQVQPQTSAVPGASPSQKGLPPLPPTGTGSSSLAAAQQYGAARPGGRKHAGVDFDAGDNDTFYSRIGGEVIYSANAGGGYGNVVDVYNKELGVTERIAEGSKNLVRVGQNISPGTPVQQGTHQTGVFHYEIRKGKATGSGSFEGTLDPIAFLKNKTTQTQVAQSPTTQSAQVAQTAAPTPSIPSPTGRGNIVPLPIPTGGGAQQSSSGTAPNQAPVPRFSSEDPNNTTTMVVRAIYNIVG